LPPVPFEELVDAVAPEHISSAVAALLALKRNTGEMGMGASVPAIDAYIQSELQRHGLEFTGQARPELVDATEIRDELNEIFRAAVWQGDTRELGETRSCD
jgi:predicted nucleotidyltransferase